MCQTRELILLKRALTPDEDVRTADLCNILGKRKQRNLLCTLDATDLLDRPT